MKPLHAISRLFETGPEYPQNLALIKKILLTTYLGRLRVNGQAPDDSVSIGDYLCDDERTVLDFTRLSDEKREAFLDWFLSAHQQEKNISFWGSAHVTEYQGYTTEVAPGWWGRLRNWLRNRYSEVWKLNEFKLSPDYQITGVELCHGQQGILLGFNQFLTPSTGNRYRDPQDLQRTPLGNTKRAHITDQLVDLLKNTNIDAIDFLALSQKRHLQAIPVPKENMDARLDEMYKYRKVHNFIEPKAWYQRLWRWCASWFVAKKVKVQKERPPVEQSEVLLQTDTVRINRRQPSGKITVLEKRPGIENIVFCGGGPKIFAHIGVLKALEAANIKPKRFSGTSAGAIVSLMAYLGYSADEIAVLFKGMRERNLINVAIDWQGMSDSTALKAAIDYAIISKVQEVVEKYNIPYPEGKITYAVLESIKKACPGCGWGEELTVNSTNKRLNKSCYYSYRLTPDKEVSESVMASALYPILFREAIIDGHEHNDGGILSNFSTEVFTDDQSTLLESEYGNNLKVLATWFEETGHQAMHQTRTPVHRETFIENKIYSLLTGVRDPVNAWEKDRVKLRQYAMQSIIPELNDITISGFSVGEAQQAEMIKRGFDATNEYLKQRYGNKPDSSHESQELMYENFDSLNELLAYCAYRGKKEWFDKVYQLIKNSPDPEGKALSQADELADWYFALREANEQPKESTDCEKEVYVHANSDNLQHAENIQARDRVFLQVFDILRLLEDNLVKNKKDVSTLASLRHSLTRDCPLIGLTYFSKIEGDYHVILDILRSCMYELQQDIENQSALETLGIVHDLLKSGKNMTQEHYYGHWNLSYTQSLRVLKIIDIGSVKDLLADLRQNQEEMQTVRNKLFHDPYVQKDKYAMEAEYSASPAHG